MPLPFYVEQGQGSTTVLLLHGIGGNHTLWGAGGSGTVQALAQAGYRVLALDLPGYGQSAAMGAPSMGSLVAAVDAVVTQCATSPLNSRVVLLGHSMGGMVAQELVALHPQAVQGLVLACTSALFGKADGAWQARFVAERLAPLDAGLGMAGMAAQLVPGLVAPTASDAVRAVAAGVMAQVPEATYRAALQAIAGFDRREALAHISMPTLLLAGEHDRTAPPDVMQRMATRMAGAHYTCLAQAGHIANLEQPAAFNAAVLAFLQQYFKP
jgi:3-oxoadipate enol-lactonase